MPTTPQQELREAAEYLRRYGWQQNASGGYGEPACALGAICCRTDDQITDDEEDTQDSAMELLHDYVGEYVPEWNDAPGRTAAEVIQALEEAAAR